MDPSAISLRYSSVLWPGYEFKANAKDGHLESARYWHYKRELPHVDSPIGLPIWSMDLDEFAAGVDRHGCPVASLVSGLKLSPEQLQHVINDGKLGGGD